MATKASSNGIASFRVSDVVPVPLRGYMLRLRLVDGEPAASALRPGRSLRLVGPDGGDRVVQIRGVAVPSGRARARADRLSRMREIDVIVAGSDGEPVRIGWTAEPAR